MIAGGYSTSKGKAYIINVVFGNTNKEKVIEISYTTLKDIPFSGNYGLFSTNCNGRLLLNGGENYDKLGELEGGLGWNQKLPSLKVGRCFAWASYIESRKHIFVSGGVSGGKDRHKCYVDSIERLYITTDENGVGWETCKEHLPVKVMDHTTITIGDNLYLIGGNIKVLGKTNRVWKGVINELNDITFEELPSMEYKRSSHVAVPYQGKIIVMGGEEDQGKYSTIEIFNGESWEKGPQLPFYFDRKYGNAILNKNGMIVIMTHYIGFAVYNCSSSSVQHYKDFRMKDDRRMYTALLI